MIKKVVCVDGSLALPLQVGKRAVIRRGGDFIFTSLVVDIRDERAYFACFETMNSVYKVSLVPVPVEAAIPYPLMKAA